MFSIVSACASSNGVHHKIHADQREPSGIGPVIPVSSEDSSVRQYRWADPTEIHFTVSEGKDALYRILDDIKSDLSARNCIPAATIAIFDLDETTLVVGHQARSIRDSDKILRHIQKLGVSTLAVTARSAISSDMAFFFESNPELFAVVAPPHSEPYAKIQVNSTLQDVRTSGLNFEKGIKQFKNENYAFFNERGVKQNHGFFWPDDQESLTNEHLRNPIRLQTLQYYESGVVLASQQNKGRTIKNIFERTGLKNHFTCLYFADDNLTNTQDVKKAFRSDPVLTRIYVLPHFTEEAW